MVWQDGTGRCDIIPLAFVRGNCGSAQSSRAEGGSDITACRSEASRRRCCGAAAPRDEAKPAKQTQNEIMTCIAGAATGALLNQNGRSGKRPHTGRRPQAPPLAPAASWVPLGASHLECFPPAMWRARRLEGSAQSGQVVSALPPSGR